MLVTIIDTMGRRKSRMLHEIKGVDEKDDGTGTVILREGYIDTYSKFEEVYDIIQDAIDMDNSFFIGGDED